MSAAVSGLTPGRLFHFRLVATSDAGTSRGVDRTFSTAGAPTAATGSATAATTRSARLAGTVNPNGQTTSWYFEYGASTSYGGRTTARNAGSGARPVNVASSPGGLRRATTYHYRLVAVNASGTSLGSDRTFRTAGPPIARTGPTVEIGSNAAKPTGTVNPQGRRTTWYFEYGTTTRYGSRTPATGAGSSFRDQAVSAPIARLRTAAAYHYRLVARNDAGTTRGADLTFRTSGVSLAARLRRIVFGRAVMLTGFVPTARAGESVTVFAQRFGAGSPTAVATVITGNGGLWRFLARPTIRTSYVAHWNDATSRAIVIGVRPRVAFRRVARNSVPHSRPCGSVLPRPARQAPAADVGRQVGDGEARPAEPPLGEDLPLPAAAKHRPAADGDEREPGRPRLPGRLQPHDPLPPLAHSVLAALWAFRRRDLVEA